MTEDHQNRASGDADTQKERGPMTPPDQPISSLEGEKSQIEAVLDRLVLSRGVESTLFRLNGEQIAIIRAALLQALGAPK